MVKWEVGEIADVIAVGGMKVPVKIIHVGVDAIIATIIANDEAHHRTMSAMKLFGYKKEVVDGHFHPETGEQIRARASIYKLKLIKRQ